MPSRPDGTYDLAMLATYVWHYWISFFLVIPALLVFVALGIGYFVKVVGPRSQRR